MTRTEIAALYPGWEFHELGEANRYFSPQPLAEWAARRPEQPVYRNRGAGAVWLHPDPEFAGCFGKITPPTTDKDGLEEEPDPESICWQPAAPIYPQPRELYCVPPGAALHHRCGNCWCLNPKHMEIVSPRQNRR